VGDAKRAQSSVEDSYERYKQTVDDYKNCRSYPDIYDLMRDRCQSRRWEVDSVKSEADRDLSTFNSRMRGLANAFDSVASSCGTRERGCSGLLRQMAWIF
jgi:hypothetical protein